MSDTMKALLLRQHGGLENLELVTNHPKPTAKPGSVVIRVRASSFNYHDVFTVKGMPGIKVPLPVIIGLDMAGEVTQGGAGGANGETGGRRGRDQVESRRSRAGQSGEQEKGPDGRDARRRHGGILPRRGRPARRDA